MVGRQRTYPWRDGRRLTAVLADGRPWLERHRIVHPGSRCDAADLAAAETRHARRMSADVRTLLTTVRPNPPDPGGNDGPVDFGFTLPNQEWFSWTPLTGEEFQPSADWANAEGLGIGTTGLGDDLFWVQGHRVHPDGCIAAFSADAALGGLMLAVVARSLAELIARAVMCDCIRPGNATDLSADSDDDAGPIPPLDMDVADTLFQSELAGLNPAATGRAT